MLHELLFALTGHYGGLFKDTGNGIQVVKGVPFIHPSEEAQLDRLCQLGTFYKKFTDFINKHGLTLGAEYTAEKNLGTLQLHGLYLKSFCHGLDRELESYREKLGSLESDVLGDPDLGLTHFQCELDEYFLLFPAIDSVIEQIETQKAHGCYILEILHKNTASGLTMVKSVLQRVLKHCHLLMYKHLCSWILYGELTDHYQEFFIQEDTNKSKVEDSSEVEDLGVAGVTEEDVQTVLDQQENQREVVWFCLRADLLPSYIPVRVANKILFIGESIQMFQPEKNDIHKMQDGPIPEDMQKRYTSRMHTLAQLDEFSLMEFEGIVDELRLYVAERLWLLIVDESNLIVQLKIIKDFYLLGRGELYLAFIDLAQDYLVKPPTSTVDYDINSMFVQSANKVLIMDEGLLQKFRLSVAQKAPDTKEKSKKQFGQDYFGEEDDYTDLGWKGLSLKYHVERPLNILLSDTVLDRYNTVFQFLLAVKRTQLKLQKSWMLQMQGRKSQIAVQDRAKWQLRTHMAFLVDNLQYFLQVDVIDSQFSILIEKINSTRDFETIKLAHDQFLAGLLAQSFVHMKPVSHCLNRLLAICSAFCNLIQSCGDTMTRVNVKIMENIAKKFQWQSNLLFKLLTSVRDHSASPHLAQLLLRLDYNRYFTTSGGQLGSL